MHVVFRLDASRSIGLGHLSRSSNLAAALGARGIRSSFIVGGEGGASLARARLPAEIEVLPVERSGSGADLDAITARAASARARWVIVDHYGLDAGFLSALRARVTAMCVIDDLADRDLRMADLVVNSTPAGELVSYPEALEPRLLRGDYVLLHPAFAAHRREGLASLGAHPRVLVSFGGTDAAALVPSALGELRARWPDAELRAVVGVPPVRRAHSRPVEDEARSTDHELLRAEGSHGVTFFHEQSPEAMASHMSWAELAIATPSTVAWELAAVGTPAILCRVAANQVPTARYFRALGAFPVLEEISGLGKALAWLEEIDREDLTRRARLYSSTCDGMGAERLATRLAAP